MKIKVTETQSSNMAAIIPVTRLKTLPYTVTPLFELSRRPREKVDVAHAREYCSAMTVSFLHMDGNKLHWNSLLRPTATGSHVFAHASLSQTRLLIRTL